MKKYQYAENAKSAENAKNAKNFDPLYFCLCVSLRYFALFA